MDTLHTPPTQDPTPMLVAAFYKFAPLDDLPGMQTHLRQTMEAHGVKGSILLAPEGVNGTIAGPDEGVQTVLAALRAYPTLTDLEHKESTAPTMPFGKTKVRLKKEIITMRQPQADPNQQVGTYVAPEAWNELISRDDVTLLDTRNTYEVVEGTFKGAIDPTIESFTEFADFVDQLDPQAHPKVAMFCTGGVRCEKASAYMLAKGFKEVYHLKGGILKYLENVPAENSLWDGTCFVFDERETVGHGLAPAKARHQD